MALTLGQALQSPVAGDGATLIRRLHLAAELALRGPEPAGRDLCAAIFLEHALLLSTDPNAIGQFIECLLLLRMESLLHRAIRSLYGFDPKRMVLTPEGEQRSLLAFPSGESFMIPWPQPGADLTKRQEFAEAWTQRILSELDTANTDHAAHVTTQDVQKSANITRERHTAARGNPKSLTIEGALL